MSICRVCSGAVREFFDFGLQPLSSAFVDPAGVDDEYFFPLSIGVCQSCTMVQLLTPAPRGQASHEGYPYHSSGSRVMHKHFQQLAHRLLETELSGPDPFIVEIGYNDGVVLKTVRDAGVRHLGVEPTGRGAVRVHSAFFNAGSAAEILASEGPADVVYAANTICEVAEIAEIFEGLKVLLAPDGVLVFEDPYLGEILERTAFDQIYDEHFYFFSASAVSGMAERFGFALVDVEHLPVHGGQIRYTIARRDRRRPTQAVADLLAREREQRLVEPEKLQAFATAVDRIRDDLLELLTRLRAEGKRVVGYGATAKSATVTNYFGIGPDLVPFVCDSTPSKQGLVTPGSHIPVRPPADFADPYPDYALLFAWNHAEEIMAKERAFRDAGGQWILYVPEVHVL
ncbi:class I SAM-dependent methyltransferase [Natronosporangium hydrolyticum]|uniref:Class I SAM-dependent methyltransferase n=1 Tax=Natronosporangium hydrolyticum TaxID=2811111 RepID=A0A895YMW0_9ACTN|nr:class I SAM-dependent methyltransferase [Natronosporangium hydrolyticum]QSB16026.1 class I SAM-dependent methyltransferase [Natronosporangium hydrolyticum]